MRLNTRSAPEKAIIVCLIISALGWAAIAWGLQRPGVLTETVGGFEALAIGLGIPPAVMPLLISVTFVRQARAIRAARRGKGVIGRWRLTLSDLARFRANELLRETAGATRQNCWRCSGKESEVEIIFTAAGVVVGRIYFPLATTGHLRSDDVRVLPESPLVLAFAMVLTSATAEPSLRVIRETSELRLPASSLARSEFLRVADHFRHVASRQVIVEPNRHRATFLFGLSLMPVSLVAGLIGWWFLSAAREHGQITSAIIPVTIILSVLGVLIGALLAASSAFWRHRLNHR